MAYGKGGSGRHLVYLRVLLLFGGKMETKMFLCAWHSLGTSLQRQWWVQRAPFRQKGDLISCLKSFLFGSTKPAEMQLVSGPQEDQWKLQELVHKRCYWALPAPFQLSQMGIDREHWDLVFPQEQEYLFVQHWRQWGWVILNSDENKRSRIFTALLFHKTQFNHW